MKYLLKAFAERADGKPIMHCIPNHCGIEEDEVADTLAKLVLIGIKTDAPTCQAAGWQNRNKNTAYAMLQQDGTSLTKSIRQDDLQGSQKNVYD